MKKRWKAWLSFVMALVLFVSFSFCSEAAYTSFPAYVNFATSSPITATGILVTSTGASLDFINGSIYESQNSIFLGVGNGNSSQDNIYTAGYAYWRLSDMIDGREESNLLYTFDFSTMGDISIARTDNISIFHSNGPGFFAVAPYSGITSPDQFIPLYHTLGHNRFHVDSYGRLAYAVYYVYPFVSLTHLYVPSRTYLSLSITSGSVMIYKATNSTASAATGQDILDQTSALNKTLSDQSVKLNNINNAVINETRNQTDAINKNITQETQKQTDTLTNGYDNSGLNSDNDRLASSMDSFDNAESQVTDQSVEYIDAVTFFDPTTHLQLMSCITFTSTFLQNLFVALGDWSVLVMIALSLAFALMLIGWFKYRK